MNNFVVVVFPDEAAAFEGIRGLQELHREGRVTVYATVVLQREPNGELSIRRHSNQGPLGLGVGALAGGLVAALGAPAGPAASVAAGALAGSLRDALHGSLSDDLIEVVQRDLMPGTSAVIGEVSEESIEPIDARMNALGGKITRERREALVAGYVAEDTAPIRADLADLSAEAAGERVELLETKLDFDIKNAKENVQRAVQKVRERVDRAREAIEAKLEVLQDQVVRAKPEARERIQQRISDLRRDLEQREETLKQADELASEALR